jgi:lysozyme
VRGMFRSIPPRLFGTLSRVRQRGITRVRVAISVLTISAASLVATLNREALVCAFESGCKAYPDPVHGAKVPTIGAGTTVYRTGPDAGQRVKMGDTIPTRRALAEVLAYKEQDKARMDRCVRVPLSQVEFDLYLDLSYNIGIEGFCGSQIVKQLNAGNYVAACGHILDWRRSGKVDCSLPNKVCGGLWADRQAKHKVCVAEANAMAAAVTMPAAARASGAR